MPQLTPPSPILAFEDTDFLKREELRGIRMQLELLKPNLIFSEHGINQTIVIFGSARTSSTNNNYYLEARRLGALITTHFMTEPQSLIVVTGGGGGIMEAVNRGASDVGGKSAGLNISLPHEQIPNAYITPDLCFEFEHFSMRKMQFFMRAKALVVFPGGFGTLDELFEALTLIQTQKIPRIPVILYDKFYWENIINFNALLNAGMISADDLALIEYAQTSDEAWEIISCFMSENE
jgi:uncharacterized protein (TIGR00730 family)